MSIHLKRNSYYIYPSSRFQYFVNEISRNETKNFPRRLIAVDETTERFYEPFGSETGIDFNHFDLKLGRFYPDTAKSRL